MSLVVHAVYGAMLVLGLGLVGWVGVGATRRTLAQTILTPLEELVWGFFLTYVAIAILGFPLGCVGYLTPGGWMITIWSLVGLGVFLFKGLRPSVPQAPGALPYDPRNTPRSDEQRPFSRRLLHALAVFPLALVILYPLLDEIGQRLAQPVLVVSDAPIYHLPFAIRWWQTARLDWVATPFGELGATYFPAAGSLWLHWLICLTGDDFFARVGQAPFAVANLAWIFAFARRLGAMPTAAFWSVGAWLLTLPAYLSIGQANVDLPFMLGLLIAVSGLTLPALSARQSAIAVGLGLGVAIATKTIGLVFAGPLLICFWWRYRFGDRYAWSVLVCLVAITGGVWLTRNTLATGNPLFPVTPVPLLLPGLYTPTTMRTSAYHIEPDWLGLLLPRWEQLIDGRLAMAVLLLAAFGILRLSRRPTLGSGIGVLVAVPLVWIVSYVYLIPYNSQERFLLPAWAIIVTFSARGWGIWTPPVLLLGTPILYWRTLTPAWRFLVGQTPVWDWGNAPVLIDLASASRVWPKPWPMIVWIIFVILTSMCLTLILVGIVSRPTRLRFAVGSIFCLLFSLTVGWQTWWIAYRYREIPEARFYPTVGFGRDMFAVWMALEQDARRTPNAVVAYAGTNLPYYLAGPELRRRVVYVSIGRPIGEGYLHRDFDSAQRSVVLSGTSWTPYPSFYRLEPRYEVWVDNLKQLGVTHVVVARENRHGRVEWNEGLAPFPLELEWARATPWLEEVKGEEGWDGGRGKWGYVFRVKK